MDTLTNLNESESRMRHVQLFFTQNGLFVLDILSEYGCKWWRQWHWTDSQTELVGKIKGDTH